MALFDRRFKDYRFAEVINEKGKRTVVLDYIGNYFYYQDADRAKRARPLIIAYGVVMMFCWLTALMMRISALTVAYISIPYVVSLIGVVLACRGVWVVMRKKEPLIRTDADAINFKLMIGSGACVVMVGISFVGTIVGMIVGVNTWWGPLVPDMNNIIFLGLCLMYMISAALLFRLRKAVDLVEKFRESEAEKAKDDIFGKDKKASLFGNRKRADDNAPEKEAGTAGEDAEEAEKDGAEPEDMREKNLKQEQMLRKELQEKTTAKDAEFKEID